MKDVFTIERMIWIRRQQRRQYLIDLALNVCVVLAIALVYYVGVR